LQGMFDRNNRQATFRIVAAYVIVSSLWIVLSDTVMKKFIHDSKLVAELDIFKGLLFILVTAAILFRLVSRYVLQMSAAQQRLRSESEKLELTDFSINNITDAVYWITTDGRFRNVNEAACRMLGYQREELLSLSVSDIDTEFSSEDIRLNHEKLKESEEMSFERFHKTRDGRIIPVEITANYLVYNGVEFFCAIARDITERIRSEREASFFKALIEYSRDPFYVLDPHDGFRMVYVNREACLHFGMDMKQILDMRIPDWDSAFDMERVDAMMEQQKQGKSIRFETVHRISTGDLVPVEVTTNYLVHDGKEYIAGYFHNISGRKAMESALKDGENRFRTLTQEFQALLNGIPDALTLISPELKILWINSVTADIFGRESGDVIGRQCYELWHGRSTPCENCPVLACFISGKQDMRTIQNPPDRIMEVRVVPVKDENGKVVKVIEVGRDVTEQKNLEHQLNHAQKMEAVGQLAGGIAHDFNNILTATIGFASLMLMKMDGDNQLRHYAEQILTTSEKAAALTQSLLAFSRKKIISLQPTDLNEVLRNGKKLLLRLIREDIEVRDELCPESLVIMADSVQLEQVFMNLVTNARDAMPEGGELHLKTALFAMDDKFIHTHGYGKTGKYACISISDTGMGMEEKTRERIFEPFFTTKEMGKGTGLGLATVYGIVRQHDGYINVYSEPGRGTTFRIYLPLASGIMVEYEKSKPSQLVGGVETVLLAEDDEYVRKSDKEILENFGYSVIEAADGEEAIEKFTRRGNQIDMLLLDVIMPKKNGKEVYDAIKNIRPDIKVVFMSGYTADVITRKKMLDENMHFVEKPVSPKVLLTKMREVFNK
jgi:two-component system cell cycle sensor histidine kinase/response regulator CckA